MIEVKRMGRQADGSPELLERVAVLEHKIALLEQRIVTLEVDSKPAKATKKAPPLRLPREKDE